MNIALENTEVSSCPRFDANDDGEVTINELTAGVNAAVLGCEVCPSRPVCELTGLIGTWRFETTVDREVVVDEFSLPDVETRFDPGFRYLRIADPPCRVQLDYGIFVDSPALSAIRLNDRTQWGPEGTVYYGSFSGIAVETFDFMLHEFWLGGGPPPTTCRRFLFTMTGTDTIAGEARSRQTDGLAACQLIPLSGERIDSMTGTRISPQAACPPDLGPPLIAGTSFRHRQCSPAAPTPEISVRMLRSTSVWRTQVRRTCRRD